MKAMESDHRMESVSPMRMDRMVEYSAWTNHTPQRAACACPTHCQLTGFLLTDASNFGLLATGELHRGGATMDGKKGNQEVTK